jgi:arylsulfatase A-like enzyme
MKTAFWIAATLCAIASSPLARAVEPARKPNVIFIICDDLGYGDLGAYGQKKIKTSNLDRLAKEGMLFTQHYSGSPVCAPSRSCLLTGQHTGHTPVRANPSYARGWDRKQGDAPLPGDAATFPKLFKQAGYATAAIGKWGLGRPGTSGDPKKHGFDLFFGYADHGAAHEYYPEFLWRNAEKVQLDGKQYSHDLFAAEALDFVRKQKDNLFLLYLAFTIPHQKLQVPSLDPYTNESWPEPVKTFAAMITRMDGDVGRLVKLLEELKIDRNTLVIFTSDNGPQPMRQVPERHFDSNGPLRGRKRDVYEGGIRVPLIARWPGRIQPGQRSDHACANWDMLATFADVLGVQPPAGVDGISILPTLLGQPERQKAHEYLYWDFNEQGGRQALRAGDWKGVRVDLVENPNAPMELYNLKDDLGETKDVAAQHPDIVKRLSGLMEAAYVPTERYPRWSPPKKPGKTADDE